MVKAAAIRKKEPPEAKAYPDLAHADIYCYIHVHLGLHSPAVS